MTLCRRCNAGGKCRNCVCVKNKRQCRNCLPSRKGCCSNMVLLPALQVPEALPAPPVQDQPPLPVCVNTIEVTSAFTNATTTPAAAQEPDPGSTYPINAHPGTSTLPSPALPCPLPSPALPCPLPPPIPMPKPSFMWGEYDSASIMHSMDETYKEVVHWRKNTFPVPQAKALFRR